MNVRPLFVLMIGMLLSGVLPPFVSAAAASPTADVLAFAQTGHTLRGEFRRFWEAEGGLAVFGYPLTEEQQEQTAEGTFVVQYFERNRLELHPNNARPYNVLLGRLGATLLPSGAAPTPGQVSRGCQRFAATGHTVCGPFLQYWQRHGIQDAALNAFDRSLALFGAPLTEPRIETNSSGDTVLTQWFERARFEDHGAAGGVLLGLLGREARARRASSCEPLPKQQDGVIRPGACLSIGATMSIDANNFMPNERVSVWLTSPDNRVFGGQYTLQADGTGTLYNLTYPTASLWPGQWYWVLEGNQSQHRSVVFFYVHQV